MKRDYKDYLLLTAGILLIVFLVTRFVNLFGSDTDWINQHTVIPDYFRQVFYKTGKLIPNFSFNYGAGENIFNLSYYGLLSPIILVSYLLPFVSMKDYIIGSSILIVIASTILFYKWLRLNGFDNNLCLLSSFLFAFSCPLIYQMHRHIMFVNYMPFLVMSLIGVDKYLTNNNKTTLILGVFLMIMTSYYYSVCGILVIVIYFLYKYFDNKEFSWKNFLLDSLKFIGYIMIGILMSSVLLLPTAYTILAGRGDSASNINLIKLFIPSVRVHKFFCGTYSIGVGLIGFIALIYMLFTKKRSNIILAILTLTVLLMPIFMFLLNGGLYLREKCFIPFIPLICFIVAYFLNDLKNDKIEIRKFVILSLIILFVLFLFELKQFCFILAFIFLFMLLIPNIKLRNTVCYIYILCVAFGFCVGENFNEDYVSHDMYNNIFDKSVSDSINEVIKSDNGFYRFNDLVNSTKVVNKIYNERYYTTNNYSSTYNNKYLNFVRKTFKSNILDYNNFLFSGPKNLLFNIFMGVKYLHSDSNPGLGYTHIGNNIYKNDNVLPLIYFTDRVLNKEEFIKYDYPYTEELLLKNVVVDKESSINVQYPTVKNINLDYDIIENSGIDIKNIDDQHVLSVKEKGHLLLKLKNPIKNKILFLNLYGLKPNACSIDNISISINNVTNILTCKTWPYPNYNNTFRYIISDAKIEYLDINLSKGEYNISSFDAYVLPYNSISKNNVIPFQIDYMADNKINGQITVNSDGYLVTSIPYDNGFTVKVNGQKIDYSNVNNGFIGLKLAKGSYNIEIVYNSPFLKAGIILSLIGTIAFIFVSCNKKQVITSKKDSSN